MVSIRFDVSVGKQGYKSPEEVEEKEKEILALFKDEKDEKTFKELLKLAKEKTKRKWCKSSFWRYLERMVKEQKLIKKGEGRGAVYRCNLVELMKLDHYAYLDKIRKICSQERLDSFHNMGAVDCTIFGIPSEGLTDYERLVAQAIADKLSASWLLLFELRGNCLSRYITKKEVIDFFTLRSLYQHDFNEMLGNILELSGMKNPKTIKDFFQNLEESMISWLEKNKIRFPTNIWSLHSLMKQYDLERADETANYPSTKYTDGNVELIGEELVAMTVTGSMMYSQEFSQRIENWLNYWLLRFFETARRCEFSKAQEIGEVTLEIFETISPRRKHFQPRGTYVLGKEEKERLLNWDLLLNRYGEENTKFILNLVEEAASRFTKEKSKFHAQKWIAEKTDSYLKQKGLMDLYGKEKFFDNS